ncbi:MAG TPA: acyl-CoA dehydrogenase family protein [Conexibacter sp.]|jgi:alkylation response protein AidB-like acyl-CoA dehydrogenase
MSSTMEGTIKLLASEDAAPLVEGFAALVDGHTPGSRSDAFFADRHEEIWRALGEGDWFDLGVAASAGGAGLDGRDLLEISEAWGRSLFPVPFTTTMLVARWRGTSGGLAAAGATFAVADGSGALAPFGDWPGISLLGADGALDAVGPLGAVDTFAPSLPLAVVDGASPLPPQWLDELRACLAAEAVGATQAALTAAIAYAHERKAYGKPIGSFQAMKHLLADVKRDVELARSAAVWAAQVSGAENLRAAATGVELCQRATASCIQVFAGIGFTWELDLHFLLRHVMAIRRVVSAGAAGLPGGAGGARGAGAGARAGVGATGGASPAER